MNMHSKSYLLVCLALGGCLESIDAAQDPEAEQGNKVDEPTTSATEQALGNGHFDQRGFGGNIVGTPFGPYVTGIHTWQAASEILDPQGDCSPGTVRPVTASVQWTSTAGGWCQFAGWYSGDAHDCRAKIQGSTGGGWFGGTCTSTVQEVPELQSPQGVFSYTAGNTGSATANTTNYAIALNAGQTLTVTVCGELGSSFSGDTYFRLFDLWGNGAAQDDDTCGRGSRMVYTATSGGSFQIHAGCWSSGSCSGRVAWFIQ